MATAENLIDTLIILFSSSLLFAWVIATAINRMIHNTGLRLVIYLSAYGLSLVPIQGTLIAEYIQGYFGNLSVSSIILILLHILSRLSPQPLFQAQEKQSAFLLLFSTGCFLYPFTMGLTLYDPYALGYQPIGLGAALCATALFAWWLKKYLIMTTILLCITIFMLQIGDSRNLWDYLIDPLIFLYIIFWFAIHMTRRNKV